MNTWTRAILIIPAEHKDAANRLASIFDFDTGGAKTFEDTPLSPTGEEPVTHYMANTPIKSDYIAALADPEMAFGTLNFLSKKYRREPPTRQDVDVWCEHVAIGEPTGLFPIVQNDEEP